jgi:hypothetical protein
MSGGCWQVLKSPHIIGLFCHYSRSLLTHVWSTQARALESVLSRGTMRDEDLDDVSTWTRTTLATGSLSHTHTHTSTLMSCVSIVFI